MEYHSEEPFASLQDDDKEGVTAEGVAQAVNNAVVTRVPVVTTPAQRGETRPPAAPNGGPAPAGPASKPPRHPQSRLKPSDSSFGLHSPDNLPPGFNPQDEGVQVRNYPKVCSCEV